MGRLRFSSASRILMAPLARIGGLVEFRILGQLEVVTASGEALSLGTARQPRAVLALLLAHAPEPVSRDRLVDELWGERPPATAAHAVHVYVSGIRKLLQEGSRDASSILCFGPSGYRLLVEPEQVDARRFERLMEEGRRALRAAAFEDAGALFGEALALWRGPAYADFLYCQFAQTEAGRLEEFRLEALEGRLEARVSCGEYPSAVAELEAFVAEHSLREHARCLLMRALYGAGRQVDALAVYRVSHRILSELGLEPGRELRDLEQAILGQADLDTPDVHDVVAPGQRADGLKLPLPRALVGEGPPEYVGREVEHALVRERFERVVAEKRQGLLISGEPGIGKTQFASRAARELHGLGAVVLLGRCTEDLAAPYGPWIQALTPLIEGFADEALAAHVDQHSGQLGRLIPTLDRRVPHAPAHGQSDPETERYLLFSSVVGLLERACRLATVVLLLEDLHWADESTLVLLKHVLSESASLRLFILATFREGDAPPTHPLRPVLADLWREQWIERVELLGLGEEEVRTLLNAVADERADGDRVTLTSEIVQETGGNPFFVAELLRHLAETGALASGAGLAPQQLGLPESVLEVVTRRVTRLGEECSEALRCAAVIGPGFDLQLLGRVAPLAQKSLIDALERAVQANLLTEQPWPPGCFSFTHELINHALYEKLSALRRAQVHRRVAEALEEACADDVLPHVEELARHWSASIPPDFERATSYCKLAGEKALAKLAPDEALRWLTRALEFADADQDGPVQCDLQILLGDAQQGTGNPEFRETLLRAAKLADRLGDGERMSRAVLANNRGFASSFGVVDAERVAMLERAVEMNPSGDPARRGRLRSLLAMELQFDPDYQRRRKLADEGLALAREAADDARLVYVLRDHFHATWSADTLEQRRQTVQEMQRLAARSDDPLAQIWAVDRAVHVAIESGLVRQALPARVRLDDLSARLGQPGLRWHAAYYAAGVAHLRGDLEEADRLAETAARVGEQAGEQDVPFIYGGQVALVRAEQGRAGEVVELLEQAAAHITGAPYDAALAAVRCELGRTAEARELLDLRSAHGFRGIPRDQNYSTALALWGKVAADVGAQQAAAELYALLLPFRDHVVWNGANGLGSVQFYLGMLAATRRLHDLAAGHFAAASRLHVREGIKGWEARNLSYWAMSMLTSGAAEDAVATAERALALARQGAYPVSERLARRVITLAGRAKIHA